MNADTFRSLQRSWVLARKSRAVDKKGLAVALTFLVAMFFGVRECSDKTTEQVSSALQEQPDLSAEIEIRSAGRMAREAEFSGPVQSMTAVRRELDDPMRPVSMERRTSITTQPVQREKGTLANQERGTRIHRCVRSPV